MTTKTLFIQAQTIGVQAELFTVTYTTPSTGDVRIAALDTSGNTIFTITRSEVLLGYSIVVDIDAINIFLCIYKIFN